MTVFYCIEDELSRAVAERLIRDCCPHGTHIQELGKVYGGNGYIKKNLKKFCDLAKRHPVFILTDLDREACPPSLRERWFNSANIQGSLPENMLFCIAQTEIESWLIADVMGLADFLRINSAKIRCHIDMSVVDSKEYLVSLARGSKDASIRNDLVPENNSGASTGLSYNYRLSDFVKNDWNHAAAAQNSRSLKRAIDRLSSLVF